MQEMIAIPPSVPFTHPKFRAAELVHSDCLIFHTDTFKIRRRAVRTAHSIAPHLTVPRARYRLRDRGKTDLSRPRKRSVPLYALHCVTLQHARGIHAAEEESSSARQCIHYLRAIHMSHTSRLCVTALKLLREAAEVRSVVARRRCAIMRRARAYRVLKVFATPSPSITYRCDLIRAARRRRSRPRDQSSRVADCAGKRARRPSRDYVHVDPPRPVREPRCGSAQVGSVILTV